MHLQSLLSVLESIKLIFGSNLTFIDHFSNVCHGGSVRLCARHHAYVADIVT